MQSLSSICKLGLNTISVWTDYVSVSYQFHIYTFLNTSEYKFELLLGHIVTSLLRSLREETPSIEKSKRNTLTFECN